MDIFILSYRGIEYFDTWFKASDFADTTHFYIVDNGQQKIPSHLEYLVVHRTKVNIGCAGGWNFICNVAFENMKLSKIIIGQDDAPFTQEILDDIWKNLTSITFVSGYDPSRGGPSRATNLGLFGLHKEIYKNIGNFDENYIFGCYEDNDYEYRLKLANTNLIMLKYADKNFNITGKVGSNDEISKYHKAVNYNKLYIESKWGKTYEFIHPFNDSKLNSNNIPIQPGLSDVYGDIIEFPSCVEFNHFLKEKSNE